MLAALPLLRSLSQRVFLEAELAESTILAENDVQISRTRTYGVFHECD
jgi:hypothetical protein